MSEPIHIISLGAGVQSSTMALMAAAGEITPMPKCAIFADTQAEPKSVYVWLDWLEKQLPFPLYRVTKGNLTADTLRLRTRTKTAGGQYSKTNLPTFILNKDGSKGITQRQCTEDYKVVQIVRKAKSVAKESGSSVVQWIGISLDEVPRMKESRDKMILHRWPLIEAGMNRQACLRWWDRPQWYSVRPFKYPPRSACIYCPYHSDSEWRRLRDESPTEFAEAVQFEKDLQKVKSQTDNMRGIPFLHASLKPLGEIDFSTEEERGQINMFLNECEGHCGV